VDAIADEHLRLEDVTQQIDGFNLAVVPAGVAHGPVHEVLRSPRFDQIVQEARRRYDFVVFDTPPLLPVLDTRLIARVVDGLLVIVAANQTPRKLLAESLTLLDSSKVLGIVFNRDTQPLFGYYDSSYRRYFQGSAGAA
jgi:Mrp family chromosome partitioning ATPase